jgi:invasion protein IalB
MAKPVYGRGWMTLGRAGGNKWRELDRAQGLRFRQAAARSAITNGLAVCFLLSGLGLIQGQLAAQTGSPAVPQPAGTFPTQTFKSWALDCLIPKTGTAVGKRVCFIHHEAKAVTDPKLVAARAVVRHSGPERKLFLIVELPPNTLQTDGISTVVDMAPPRSIPISGCIPKFCYGAVELTADLAAALRGGQQMKLTFTARDKGPQTVPVPLSGITAALAALESTGS